MIRNMARCKRLVCITLVVVIAGTLSSLYLYKTNFSRLAGRIPEWKSAKEHSLHVHAPLTEVTKSKYKLPLVATTPQLIMSKCPELKEILNLNDDREMDMKSEIRINKVEQLVFRNRTDQIWQSTANGNRHLEDRIWIADPSAEGSRRLTDRLSQHEVRFGDYLHLPGGHFRPATCTPRWKVAIVVPFRNRAFHLPIFLRYIIPLLQKQRLEFAIYIVNQENELAFNRGMLMNVGYAEALNFTNWDCFVFHDVDLIPQSEFNPYGCVDMPRHFVGGADNRNYRISYSTYFGGINGFTTAQFRKVNGFGNVYWGWCCQDDDLGLRVDAARLIKIRYSGQIGHYKSIQTHHNRPIISQNEEGLNRKYLKTCFSRLKTDGLSNLRYKTPNVELHTLYTNISVDIQRIPVGFP